MPQDALADAAIIFARYNLPGRTIAVEQKFSITYGEVTTPADTYTITLCGTIDRIADIGNGQYHVTDYKTSAKRTPAEVLQGYDLSMQLHFYLSAARYIYPDATLIQGSYLGIFRTLTPPKVIHGQVTSEDFARSPQYANLLAAAVRTIVSIHDNRNQLPDKEGMIYGICEKCPYVRLCSARTSEEHDGLYRRWPRNGYNPLSFR